MPLEHITFITCAILFWAQVTALPPARQARCRRLQRAAYVFAGSAPNVALGDVLAFTPTAIYPYYVHLLDRPGGISALQDQQIAAGIMWFAGDLPFGIAIVWLMYHVAVGPARHARQAQATVGTADLSTTRSALTDQIDEPAPSLSLLAGGEFGASLRARPLWLVLAHLAGRMPARSALA